MSLLHKLKQLVFYLLLLYVTIISTNKAMKFDIIVFTLYQHLWKTMFCGQFIHREDSFSNQYV